MSPDAAMPILSHTANFSVACTSAGLPSTDNLRSIKTLYCRLTVPREMQNGCWSTSQKSPHLARVAGDMRLSVTSYEADCNAVR